MGLEDIICIIGFVIIIYFGCKPKSNKKDDNLTQEIHVEGLPPSAPWNDGMPPS